MKKSDKHKLKQMTIIIIVWTFIGALLTLYDHLVLHTSYSEGPAENYSLPFWLLINSGSGMLCGILGGAFLVFFVNVKYQDKPYAYTILAVSLSFILIINIITVIRGMILIPGQTGQNIFHPDSVSAFTRFFLYDAIRIKNIIFWSVVVALTQLFLQMNSKFGYGIFWNIIRGKYNTPREEKRIFMSLDLDSSTSIAEKLGDEKYHDLLKDFFSDITIPILDNNGEIYQYVGDEVIIAWRYDDGIKNSQCVKCFFDMKNNIRKHMEKYLVKYGLVPSFKAGIHSGRVVVGEIGVLKRDITYSGDVMNTTSRIRNMCKDFGTDILVSADLIKNLMLKNFTARELGSIKLRGKEKEVLLISLTYNLQV